MRNQKNWIKKAVIYQILIDRFAGYDPKKNWKKPQFIGGNLKGIIDSLSYLKNLGVNAIWISPFYKTSAYHGYHITDFYKVDPHFGNKNDLKRLIDLIHQNDMYIIADFVPNHVSKYHPFF
ncbi:MAG: alpha-amylase family glycosyl hydrolase [Candidatus Thermoplasmatota archaeon]|nr:alpha-amylase family glycosyl hydrolase [Candidatus Thermoplasmatota archaeon]